MCSKTFKCIYCLKNHMARHMAKSGKEEEAENNPCGTCNQNFASKTVLGMHIMRVHTTLVQAFSSPVCGVNLAKRKGVAHHTSHIHENIGNK